MPSLLAYALLFTGISAFFIFSHLLIGKLVRPNRPDAEKKTIYECGEPTIGSSWIQFDLRFYVVALLFVIFDVEMAFFFPWAVVFGKANQINSELRVEERLRLNGELLPEHSGEMNQLSRAPRQRFEELLNIDPAKADLATIRRFTELKEDERENLEKARGALAKKQKTEIDENKSNAESLAWIAFLDILVFFGVLLVGFAYLWKRGDLDWVRSMAAQRDLESAEADDEEEARKVLAVK